MTSPDSLACTPAWPWPGGRCAAAASRAVCARPGWAASSGGCGSAWRGCARSAASGWWRGSPRTRGCTAPGPLCPLAEAAATLPSRRRKKTRDGDVGTPAMTLALRPRRRHHVGRVLALAALLAAPAAAGAGSITETIDRTLTLPRGGEVLVQNFNGHIEVAGGEGTHVRLVAVKTARAATDGRARAYLRELQVKIEEVDGRLVIRTVTPGGDGGLMGWIAGAGVEGHVSYRLLVPRAARVTATTVNGNVEVARLHAPVHAASTNGTVSVLE